MSLVHTLTLRLFPDSSWREGWAKLFEYRLKNATSHVFLVISFAACDPYTSTRRLPAYRVVNGGRPATLVATVHLLPLVMGYFLHCLGPKRGGVLRLNGRPEKEAL